MTPILPLHTSQMKLTLIMRIISLQPKQPLIYQQHLTLSTKIICSINQHFYGIQGSELAIFKSFLSERSQYIAIDTFTSETMDCPPCSVIQGSKLSAVLYTIYTNEIPLLHTLMSQDIYYALTNTPIPIANDIKHTTINYVDD